MESDSVSKTSKAYRTADGTLITLGRVPDGILELNLHLFDVSGDGIVNSL